MKIRPTNYKILDHYCCSTGKNHIVYAGHGDLVRFFLEEGGIDLETHYRLKKALVNRSFQTDFEIAEPRYYVHVLPQKKGYLNMSQAPTNEFCIDTKRETGEFKTKFTKKEIEIFKEMPSLKGINFDECLEEVQEDEE